MIDLVALPVWVGSALIGRYGFSAPQAGAMVTTYLFAVALASLICAPRFRRINAVIGVPWGYGMAALAFYLISQTTNPVFMFVLHFIAGASAGTALSLVHGTIGRSTRPHRLFATVTLGLGVSGIVFLGLAQSLVRLHGGAVLFTMFAILMCAAAVSTGLAFPLPDVQQAGAAPFVPKSNSDRALGDPQRIATRIWCSIVGVTFMAVAEAMIFSFMERIGAARGFGAQLEFVLIVSALMNLVAAVAVGLLERKLMALKVAPVGALCQAVLAVSIVFSTRFLPYAIGAIMFISAMIVTHTFVFGWLSLNDASGRAVALTPAMLMSGAAVGPLLGGLLFADIGENSLGVVAVGLDAIAVGCYLAAFRLSREAPESSHATVSVDGAGP
jgi:predicted MFS family arabinose efflux permease